MWISNNGNIDEEKGKLTYIGPVEGDRSNDYQVLCYYYYKAKQIYKRPIFYIIHCIYYIKVKMLRYNVDIIYIYIYIYPI